MSVLSGDTITGSMVERDIMECVVWGHNNWVLSANVKCFVGHQASRETSEHMYLPLTKVKFIFR